MILKVRFFGTPCISAISTDVPRRVCTISINVFAITEKHTEYQNWICQEESSQVETILSGTGSKRWICVKLFHLYFYMFWYVSFLVFFLY